MAAFKIEFEGVFAVVPDKPLFIFAGGKWISSGSQPLTVLFPEMRFSKPTNWMPGKPQARESHFPALIVPKDVTMTGARVPVVTLASGDRIFPLNKEIVSYKSATTLDESLAIPTNQSDVGAKTPGNRESLWWLPSMDRILNTEVTVRKDLKLGADISKTLANWFDDDLVAAFRLEAGKVFISDFNRDSAGASQWWKFRDPAGINKENRWGRIIGTHMVVELDEADTEFTFYYRGRGAASDSTLTFNGPSGVKFVNKEVDSVMLPPSGFPKPPLNVNIDLPDPDFLALYELMKAMPTAIFVPSDFGPVNAERKPCAPALFSGWDS